jgi:hypothetical protein
MSVDDTGESGEPTEVVSRWYQKKLRRPGHRPVLLPATQLPPEVRSEWRAVAAGGVTSWRDPRTGSDCYGGGLEVQGDPEFYLDHYPIC